MVEANVLVNGVVVAVVNRAPNEDMTCLNMIIGEGRGSEKV
jgi:hypothetical protein